VVSVTNHYSRIPGFLGRSRYVPFKSIANLLTDYFNTYLFSLHIIRHLFLKIILLNCDKILYYSNPLAALQCSNPNAQSAEQ
jgi:hypothetical protein